jgi:hypothetical protein
VLTEDPAWFGWSSRTLEEFAPGKVLRPFAACGAAGAYFRPVICGPNSLNNSTHESQMAE